MRHFALLFVAALALPACAPKTCDPKPLPEEYKEIGSLLPASAVVCGKEEGGAKALQLTFKERDVKKLTLEMMSSLKGAGWDVDSSSNPEIGHIMATKGEKNVKRLQAHINDQKGGPNAGSVTGSITVSP